MAKKSNVVDVVAVSIFAAIYADIDAGKYYTTVAYPSPQLPAKEKKEQQAAYDASQTQLEMQLMQEVSKIINIPVTHKLFEIAKKESPRILKKRVELIETWYSIVS